MHGSYDGVDPRFPFHFCSLVTNGIYIYYNELRRANIPKSKIWGMERKREIRWISAEVKGNKKHKILQKAWLKVSLDIPWQDVLKKKPQDSWAHKA